MVNKKDVSSGHGSARATAKAGKINEALGAYSGDKTWTIWK